MEKDVGSQAPEEEKGSVVLESSGRKMEGSGQKLGVTIYHFRIKALE